jgi:hypothetical protein
MATTALITLHVLDADQAGVAKKLLAAAGDDRSHEVLSITGGFQVPADIVTAAGLGAESAPVAKPATRKAA